MELTAEQMNVVGQILTLRDQRQPEIRVAGPAGTGKTTCIKYLLTEIDEDMVVVVTPTNKAAKVLRSKGVPAATLYSVFFTPEEDVFPGQSKKSVRFIPNHTIDKLGEGKLSYADTIIVDEASMLQTWLLAHLRRMCRTLILVGDQYQLPPVNDQHNPDGYFVTKPAHAELTTVMRQDSGSPILALATHIREGRFPENLVRKLAPAIPFTDWVKQGRKIIAFTNAHRREVNLLCRKILGFEGVLPKKGDMLICNTNHNDKILNGTEVIVREFTWKMPDLLAKLVCEDEDGEVHALEVNLGRFLMDLPDGTWPTEKLEHVVKAGLALDAGLSFSYGYCITAHKAQGSEWQDVCVIDERWSLNKIDPTGNFARRHIYTSITRAQENLIFADYRWIKNSAAGQRRA